MVRNLAAELGFEFVDGAGPIRRTENYDFWDLTVSRWDNHPNAMAHEMMAEKMLLTISDKQLLPTNGTNQ